MLGACVDLQCHGLLLRRVRLDDGTELPATEYFRSMGGYLTSHPA